MEMSQCAEILGQDPLQPLAGLQEDACPVETSTELQPGWLPGLPCTFPRARELLICFQLRTEAYVIDPRMEGGKQRETASKCLHIYNVEANSRIHVYTDRLWTEALRTASMQGAGEGAHSCLLCGLLGNAQLVTCTQLTCHIHTGHYMCRPHHMCSLLIARANLTSYAQPTYYIHTAVCAGASRLECRAHYMCSD